jgi:RND family efflux transporter MFP subunit
MSGRACQVLLALLLAGAAPAAAQDWVRGPTRPQALAALAPQADGVVRAVLVREGQRVSRGELLMELEDQLQQARIALAQAAAAAEAELRQARITLAEAQAVLERVGAAAGRGAANDWEVRQARARVEMARAGIEAAEDKRRIEARRLDVETAILEQQRVRAPFDGVVTRVDVVAGSTLSRTDRPISVADLSVLEAVLYMPAEAWPRLRVGGAYTLHLAEPVGRAVGAVLQAADPVLDAASGRFRAVFAIANADLALPAGMEAALDLARLGAP